MIETWSETLQGLARVVVVVGSLGFLVWIVTKCFIKVIDKYREK